MVKVNNEKNFFYLDLLKIVKTLKLKHFLLPAGPVMEHAEVNNNYALS